MKKQKKMRWDDTMIVVDIKELQIPSSNYFFDSFSISFLSSLVADQK